MMANRFFTNRALLAYISFIVTLELLVVAFRGG